MIKLSNVTKTYNPEKVATKAIDNINLEIKQGEFVAVIGKSGCGKSTLLNIIGGMDTPTSGEYTFNEMQVEGLKGAKLAAFRNKEIGFVFQSFYLMNEFNVIDNIGLAMGFAGKSASNRKKRAIELLKQMNLSEKAKAKPNQLSGGQQQRVAIARAIANNPSLLLADEPTGNLDEESGEMIIRIFEQLHSQGMTIIMVTHDLDLAKRADRVIHISDGKIV